MTFGWLPRINVMSRKIVSSNLAIFLFCNIPFFFVCTETQGHENVYVIWNAKNAMQMHLRFNYSRSIKTVIGIQSAISWFTFFWIVSKYANTLMNIEPLQCDMSYHFESIENILWYYYIDFPTDQGTVS